MNNTYRNRRSRFALAITGVTVVALVSGCGSQVAHDRIVAVGNGYGVGRGNVAGGTGGDTGGGTIGGSAGALGSTSGGAPGSITGGAPGTTGTGGVPGTTGTGGVPGTTGTGGSIGGGTSAATGTTSSGLGGSTASTTGASRPAGCTKALKPVVLGQTLAASGLVGAAISNLRTGLAVWAKDVNARGGVQCHEVKLFSEDDGSDPSRVTSNWNDLVHNKGAVAILGAGAPIAIAALRSAAERDKVPVVGGDSAGVDWTQSPYLFPPGGEPLTTFRGAVVEAAKATPGAKTAGMVYCVEAALCTGFKNDFPQMASKAHLAQGPAKAVSLTQSDYTAECQAMKDANVQVLFVGTDGSAATRLARNCTALGYHPTMATSALGSNSTAANDSNLRQDKLFLGTPLVPFTEAGTPGGQEFQTAMKRYAGGSVLDGSTMLGWAAGKLFEAALARESVNARAGDITTQMVLNGLWQLKNETLAGLSPGATFAKGGGAVLKSCYYAVRIDNNGFSAPNKSKATCI